MVINIFNTVALIFSLASQASAQDYTLYHHQILMGEQHIGSKNYKEAMNAYEKAFISFDQPYKKDYIRAAQIALELDQNEKSITYIKSGMSLGWSWKSIRKNTFLKSKLTDQEWAELKDSYKALNEKYISEINADLSKEISIIYKKDQRLAMQALFSFSQKAQDRFAEKTYVPKSKPRVMQILHILKTQGYPGERVIEKQYWITTPLMHHNSSSTACVKADTLYLEIRPLLIKAIRAGDMSPYDFATIDDWYILVKSARTEVGYGIVGELNSTNTSTANSLRSKIGVRNIVLRNKLVDVEETTGMDFYLEGSPWLNGKIEIAE